MTLISKLDRHFYPDQGDHWDDELFRRIVLAAMEQATRVLDLGAGAGIVKQMDFSDVGAFVCGIDTDPRVMKNPMLDEARICDAANIAYDDASFDLVYADNVLEHLSDPFAVFKEIERVLKPGGHFLFKTPNRRHYMPLVARLSPMSFHRYVAARRGRAKTDTFPTRYLANTDKTIRRLADASGLVVDEISHIEGRPEYLRMTSISYLLGIGYERIVNRYAALKSFRILLTGILRKPV